MKFPKNFTWGAATASYQIEGAARIDGKGLSIWDVYCQQPIAILGGDTGDVACDHYHLYQQDVKLMAEIGLNAYRFSTSWPRILPNGTGDISTKGLDFYDSLIDSLLAAKIEPWVTLYHWDLPHDLSLQGGWLNKNISNWFAEYTQIVVDRFSDRVSNWITFNEPQCTIGFGYLTGDHAPGWKVAFSDALLAAHNLLLAHGKSVQIIRARAELKPNIGVAPVGVVRIPATNSPADIEAARSAMFGIDQKNFLNHAWFGDPMVLGQYPEEGIRLFGKDMPKIDPKEMDIIRQPLDFYGTNIYFPEEIVSAEKGKEPGIGPTLRGDNLSFTMIGWQVRPEVIYWGLKFLFERYNLPIVITENGVSNMDWIHQDGRVHDPQRIDFMQQYIGQVYRAISDDIDVRGYFAWSLMDNFEWSFGYRQRFGLIYVDYPSQKRVLKDSAIWYKEVIGINGLVQF